jgi:putative membrane protein
VLAAALLPLPLAAHTPDGDQPPTLANAWSLEPLGLPALLLVLMLGAYLIGLRRLWRNGVGRGVSLAQALGFIGGWLLLGLALLWPLDAFGNWSLAAHMAQHMLLVGFVPPLLLLGLPLAVWMAALPSHRARTLAGPWRQPAPRRAWRVLAAPVLATALQAAVMWAWHLPAAMAAALRNDAIHYAMHASFLLAGVLFWAALLRSLREPRLGALAAMLAIVGTMIQMGLLGALLTFAETPRYAHYVERAPQLGLEPLADQQLAGLIMWVPSALPYLVGGVIVVAAWLARSEHHTASGERRQG